MISSFFHPGTSYSKNDKRRLLYEIFFAYIGYSVCGALGNYQAKLSKTKHMEKKDKSEWEIHNQLWVSQVMPLFNGVLT